MRTSKLSGFHAQPLPRVLLFLPACFLGVLAFLPAPAQAQYGASGAPYTQTGNLDNCTSSSVSLNTMAINQFYLYSASGVSVLYAEGVNPAGVNTIVLKSTPPAGATIQAAYLDVVEWWNGNTCSNAPISFGGALTPAGVESGQGNFENLWQDPRLVVDALSGQNAFFCNVRYDVTSLVSTGISSYSTNALNVGVLAGLVIVYTIPSPSTCGAVALGDGLFAWGGSTVGGSPILDYGVTPWNSTLDWSCQHGAACAANRFSRWGGINAPNLPVSISDQFFGTTSPGPTQPPFQEFGMGTIFHGTTSYDTFLDSYNNVPLSNPSGKITWALGYPVSSGSKNFYWVNLLAASCNSICATATPTNTPTVTNSGTPTFTATITNTPTITSTPTSSFTFTSSFTATNSPTPTPSATPTNSFTLTATPTSTKTPTITPSNSPTVTPTSTPTSTASNTPTLTPSNTNTYTITLTPTHSNTPTETPTPTFTDTVTQTFTPTLTFTPTFTSTDTLTPTNSLTFTFTLSPTITFTPTLSYTSTQTGTPTFTSSNTSTYTPSFTPTITFTPTSTPTFTLTSTATYTFSSTLTFTATITPTPTWTRTATHSPVPTATFPPDCDEFYVSKNSFRPRQESVSIHVAYCNSRGLYSLKLYNSAGEHIKTLDERILGGSFQADYLWDGTNKYGDSCSSGVYLVYLVEPFHKRLKRVLLVR